MPQTSQFTEIRDFILSQDDDIDSLRESYEAKGMITPFLDAKKHYVEYLIVSVAAKAFNNAGMIPPVHVEELWCIHLLETKSYRALEKTVIEKLNSDSPIKAGVEHIEHSSLKASEDITQQLLMTQTMYTFMSFEFHDERDQQKAVTSYQPTKKNNTEESKSQNDSISERSHVSNNLTGILRSLDEKDLPSDIRPIHNPLNKTGYKGVRETKSGVYFATINYKKKDISLYTRGKCLETAGKMFAWAFQIVHGRELLEEEWENNAPEEDKATRKTRKKINTLQNENVKFPFKKIPYTPRGSLQWNDDDDNDDDDEVENESVVGHGKGTSPEEDKATRKTRKMINTLQDNTYKFPSEKIPYKPRGSLQLNDDNDNDDDDDEVENESVVGHGKGTSLIAAAEIKNFLENRLPTLTAGDIPSHVVPILSTRNSSGYQGVVTNGNASMFAADIFYQGTHYRSGRYFNTALDAARLHAWAYESVHGKEKLQETLARGNANKQPRKHSAEQSHNSDKKRQKIANTPSPNLLDTLAALDIKNLPSHIVPIKNPKNKTGFKGVCNYKNSTNPWRSEIALGGRTVSLGVFENATDAGNMYSWAHEIYQGKEAYQEIVERQELQSQQDIKEKLAILDIKNIPTRIKAILSHRNETGLLGVLKNKDGTKYRCKLNGKLLSYGPYDSAVDAAKMFAWAYLIQNGEEALERLVGKYGLHHENPNSGRPLFVHQSSTPPPQPSISPHATLTQIVQKEGAVSTTCLPQDQTQNVQREKNQSHYTDRTPSLSNSSTKMPGQREESTSAEDRMEILSNEINERANIETPTTRHSVHNPATGQPQSSPQGPVTGQTQPATSVPRQSVHDPALGHPHSSLLVPPVPAQGSAQGQVQPAASTPSIPDPGSLAPVQALQKEIESLEAAINAQTLSTASGEAPPPGADHKEDQNQSNRSISTRDAEPLIPVKVYQEEEKTVSFCIKDVGERGPREKWFRAKVTTKVSRLLQTWYKCFDEKPCSASRLCYKQNKIPGKCTLADLGMKDGDELELKPFCQSSHSLLGSD